MSGQTNMTQVPVRVGRNTLIDIIGHVSDVPSKVDTGADSSSVWASNIFVDENHVLHYTLFDKKSSLYTGNEITTSEFKVAMITNSTGEQHIRYRVPLPIKLANKKIKVLVTLADRSRNAYPVLIGRRTLHGKFVVDVSIKGHEYQNKVAVTKLNLELKKDPHAFHKKYYNK